MYKYAVDNGFADRCKQRGITDPAQIEALMKVASEILEEKQKEAVCFTPEQLQYIEKKAQLTPEQLRMLYGGLAGGGIGAGLGGLMGGWRGAGLGALAGAPAGIAAGKYTPEIMALLSPEAAPSPDLSLPEGAIGPAQKPEGTLGIRTVEEMLEQGYGLPPAKEEEKKKAPAVTKPAEPPPVKELAGYGRLGR